MTDDVRNVMSHDFGSYHIFLENSSKEAGIMGLALCCLCCPIGILGGALTSCGLNCMKKNTEHKHIQVIFGVSSFSFIAGFICYIILTVKCAKVDDDPWLPWKPDGDCWSTGGDLTGGDLGQAAGLMLGLGTAGIIFSALSLHCLKSQAQTQEETGTETRGDLEEPLMNS